MGSINIKITQRELIAPVPGESRDNLILGSRVFLSNYNPTKLISTTWLWELISIPAGSAAVLLGATTSAASFIPDVTGSYLIQLTINGKIKKRIVGTVKTPNLGLTIPADREDREFGGWSFRLNDSLQKLERNPCDTSCSGSCIGGCLEDCAGSCTGNCATNCSDSCACSCSSTCTGSSNTGEVEEETGLFWNIGQCGTESKVKSLINYGDVLYAGTYPNGMVYKYERGSWVSCGKCGEATCVEALYVIEGDGGGFYAATSPGGKVFRYDEGETWIDYGQLGSDDAASALIDIDGQLCAAGSFWSGDLYIADMSWINIGPRASNGSMLSLAKYQEDIIYAGTGSGGNVYRYIVELGLGEWSLDQWSSIGRCGSEDYIPSIIVDGSTIYAGSSPNGTVWQFISGTNWVSIGRCGSETSVEALIVYEGSLYAATGPSGKVWRHTTGTTWEEVGDLGDEIIGYCMAILDGNLYVGTYPNGQVWTNAR